MTNMFKKTLVASAVFAFAGAAQAATLAGTEHSVTSQYLASTGVTSGGAANEHRAAAFTVTLGAEYTLNDTFTLTFTAPLNEVLPATLVANPDAAATPDLKGVTFSKLSGGAVGDKTVTYRLTSTDETGVVSAVTTGVVLTVPTTSLDFLKSELSSGVSVSFSAATNNNVAMDTAGGTARTASLVKVIEQFTKTAPTFARTINVERERKSFVDLNGNDTPAAATADFQVAGTFNIVSALTAGNIFARPIAAAAGVKHTLTGDFGWVVDDNTTTAGLQPKAGVFATTGTCTNPAWTYSATAISLTCDEVANNTAIVIDVEANKAGVAAANVPVLPSTSFTATSAVTFTGPAGSENVFNAASAGSWTLNGSSVNIPYMPFGTNITQVINLSNSGTQSGAITVEGFGRTTAKFGPLTVGTSEAGKQIALADAIKTALTNAGVAADERLNLTLVTNVPAADVTVYSAYNTGGNGARIVVNSSNGK